VESTTTKHYCYGTTVMELGYVTKIKSENGKHFTVDEPYFTDDTSTLFVGEDHYRNFERMCLDDIYAGKSVVYFGDSERILNKIPKERHENVQLIKPSLQPFALNVLADKHPKIHSVLLDFLKGYWDYGNIATPNLDMYVRSSIQTATLADKSFLHINRLLTDQNYLDYILSLKEDGKLTTHKIQGTLRGFWKEFNNKSNRDRQNETASTRNKLWAFLLDEDICNCLIQKDNRIDTNKIVLVDLDENNQILGVFILAHLYLTGNTKLYLKDAHLYGTAVSKLFRHLPTMISVDSLNLFLKSMLPDILGGVDRIVTYKIGLDDYRKVESLFGLAELERKPYNFYSHEAMEARRGHTVTLYVNYHDRPDVGQGKKIIRRCNSQYTLPKDRINKRIKELM